MWDEERGCRASLKHWRGGGILRDRECGGGREGDFLGGIVREGGRMVSCFSWRCLCSGV